MGEFGEFFLKILIIILFALFIVVSIGIVIKTTESIQVRKDIQNASTKQQLMKLCSNFSVQDAPVRCLEVVK